MKITAEMAQNLVEILEEIKKECFPKEKDSYPFAEWEQKRERVKQRLRELPKYVGQAVDIIQFMKPKAGQHKKLDVRKRTMLFLFARLMNKSNRDVEEILFLFEPLVGVRVSYKYIERLYSDPEENYTS